jgi:hypothetical protein
MKKFFLLIIFFSTIVTAQFKFGEAKGLFMGIEVGPRFPLGEFSDEQNIGIGANAVFSYTDDEFIPFFLYATIGYMHFPGKQSLYKQTDYSSLSSNVLIFKSGIRYYFKPILENIVLLMPIIDIGAEYSFFEKLHQFKTNSGKQNFIEDSHKFGFHIGAGFSMFILDVITYYNYLPGNQYISFNLRATIPIYVNL